MKIAMPLLYFFFNMPGFNIASSIIMHTILQSILVTLGALKINNNEYIFCDYTVFFFLLLSIMFWPLIWPYCVYSPFSLMYDLQSDQMPQNKRF